MSSPGRRAHDAADGESPVRIHAETGGAATPEATGGDAGASDAGASDGSDARAQSVKYHERVARAKVGNQSNAPAIFSPPGAAAVAPAPPNQAATAAANVLRDGPLPKRVASFDLALNSTTEVPRDQLSPILPSPLTRHANNPWESLREASPLITTLSAIVVATWAWGILQLAEVARKQMLR